MKEQNLWILHKFFHFKNYKEDINTLRVQNAEILAVRTRFKY